MTSEPSTFKDRVREAAADRTKHLKLAKTFLCYDDYVHGTDGSILLTEEEWEAQVSSWVRLDRSDKHWRAIERHAYGPGTTVWRYETAHEAMQKVESLRRQRPLREQDLENAFGDKKVEHLLHELLGYARMEGCSFGFPNDRVKQLSKHMAGPGYKDPFTGLVLGEEVHPDDFIRGTTKLWRETWMIPIIEELQRRHKVMAQAQDIAKRARAQEQELEVNAARAAEAKVQADMARDLVAANTAMLASLEKQIAEAEQRLAFLRGQLPQDVTASGRRMEI